MLTGATVSAVDPSGVSLVTAFWGKLHTGIG
jgi:hypothetical protein